MTTARDRWGGNSHTGSLLDAAARFWPKVDRAAPEECWHWTAARMGRHARYGGFWDGQRMVRAHRWSYEASVGPIRDGMELDHLCRNTICVNPAHLEQVTRAQHVLRGVARRREAGPLDAIR